MATRSRVHAALATVEAADAATALTDLPHLVLPALMDPVGPAEPAGLPAQRDVRRRGTYAGPERDAGHVTPAGPLARRFSLNRGAPDFTSAAVDLLTQLRPLLTRRVMRLSAEPAAPPGGGPEWDGLTGRQRQVLSVVAGGLTDAAIGRWLGCSPRTVDKHLEHVYRRLGVSCRTAAIAACRAGQSSPAD